MFPAVHGAAAKLIPIDSLRWITFGHVESDECGSMNKWLEAAPQATVAHGEVGCMVSLNELAGTAHLTVHEDIEVLPAGFLFPGSPQITLENLCLNDMNTLVDGPVFGKYIYNAIWKNMEREADGRKKPMPSGDLLELETFAPFDQATLDALYHTHQDYVDAVDADARRLSDEGFLLNRDLKEIVDRAEDAAIP